MEIDRPRYGPPSPPQPLQGYRVVEPDHPPQPYKYEYSVRDQNSGSNYQAAESKDQAGNVVG